MTLRVHPDEIVARSASGLLGIHPSWTRVRLSDVATVQNGFAFKSDEFSREEGIPLLRIRDVGRATTEIRFAGAFDPAYLVEPGQIVVGMDGDFRAARWAGETALLNQRVCRVKVRQPDLYDESFLLHALPGYLAAINAATSSVTVKHLSSRTVEQIPLPLPPLNEQRRVVAAIEERFSRLDSGEQSLHRGARQLRALERLLLARVTTRPAPHWSWSTVGEVGLVQLGRQRSPKNHSGPNMRPYLRVANVFEDRLDLRDVKEMNFSLAEFERYRLLPGDVLLNEGQTPELVGRPAIYRGELQDACFTNSLIRFQPGPGIEQAFALLVFRSHLHSGRFRREARITTNIAHLSANRFKSVEFPVPPLEEQRDIVTEMDGRLSTIQSMRRAMDIVRLRSVSLRRSILDQAFEGKLVPQDPSDEPASELLGRTRAERAAQSPERRTRRREGPAPAT